MGGFGVVYTKSKAQIVANIQLMERFDPDPIGATSKTGIESFLHDPDK